MMVLGQAAVILPLLWTACDRATAPDAETDVVVEIVVRPGLRDLVATASLADGSAVPGAVSWSWTRDGALEAFTTDRVPAWALSPGQTWTARATVSAPAGEGVATVTIPEPLGGNVLLVLLDDVGVDKVAAYGQNPAAGPTPTIDALAAEGIRFDRAYSSPMCSPTRAEILTGRLARRHGIGDYIPENDVGVSLSLEAFLLPEAITAAARPGYTAIIGKWHLVGRKDPGYVTHPLDSGFERFTGTIGNLGNYSSWLRVEDGVERTTTAYATSQTAEDAIAALAGLPEPFFLYLPFNAAHDPLHNPPQELHTQVLSPTSDVREQYRAMVESADTALGRILDEMGPELLARTTVIVAGDNGTLEDVRDPQYAPSGKGTTFEGGVNVPLIVTGPHVAEPGSVCDALVHLTDLYPTIADLFGAPIRDLEDGGSAVEIGGGDARRLDGQSLLPYLADPARPSERARVYSEKFSPFGPPPYGEVKRMLRDERFKVMDNEGTPFFFEYADGVLEEGPNLLEAGPLTAEQQEAYDRLWDEMLAFSDSLVYEGF